MIRSKVIVLLCLAAFFWAGLCPAEETDKEEASEAWQDLFEQRYKEYKPDFLDKKLHVGRSGPDSEVMKISTEESFLTFNLISESDRAYALMKAAREREAQGQYAEALEIYQQVINRYPEELYRVSEYGVFVPVTQYSQLRMLGFPANSLEQYRTKYDARARDAFELAWRNHSLEGLAHVRDLMLATSYGAPAMLALGDSAMDRGHWLEALEYYRMVREHFPDADARTPELRLKTMYCARLLGDEVDLKAVTKDESKSQLEPEVLKTFKAEVESAKPSVPEEFSQQICPPNLSANDYHLMPPTDDPMGLKEPEWREALPYTRRDFYVYSNPVITRDSVIYRHKNIVYSRSLLNGELRWRNNMGGRVSWQNPPERKYTHEDVLVQDGMVFTSIYQSGPTLVALDEISGQMRWAYGPMVATSQEEANMRFEAAPAGGPMTVFAGYIQDNIAGDTHTDTEYGVIAFDSVTGRIRWKKRLSRLRPGLFEAGSVRRRNRILSFASPPLYNEGTLYYTTNAGAIAALDALSGRIKWIMRYPYYAHDRNHAVHDATRQFGEGGGSVAGAYVYPHRPMFWYGQQPLLIGEDLYVLPVDSKFMFKLDRRTGKVRWTSQKRGGTAHFLGPLPSGELVMASSGRSGRRGDKGPMVLLDPETGEVADQLEDPIAPHPKKTVRIGYDRTGTRYPVNIRCLNHRNKNYQIQSRPFLSNTGQLIVGGVAHWGYPWWDYAVNMAAFNLFEKERPITNRRHYFGSTLLAATETTIKESVKWLKSMKESGKKGKRVKEEIELLESIVKEEPAENEHSQFLPFARMTFKRFGTQFELRFGPRQVEMVYDADVVKRNLSGRRDATGLFALAEVATGEGRIADAAKLMNACLSALPSEDEDFRTLVKQQLYRAHRTLARSRIRAADSEGETKHCLGMTRTVTTMDDELETRFAIADAYTRKGDFRNAALQLQSVVSSYSHYGYPVSSISGVDRDRLSKISASILDQTRTYVSGIPHSPALKKAAELLKGGMPLYFGALSPLEKDLTVRAGGWAAGQLNRLRSGSDSFAAEFETMAKDAIGEVTGEEKMLRMPEYPGTEAAQKALESLLDETGSSLEEAGSQLSKAAAARQRLWRLADIARVAGLTLPKNYADRLLAPPGIAPADITFPLTEKEIDFEEERTPSWLLLERKGEVKIEPDLLFLGGRVRTRFDNKFLLYAVESGKGETRWKATEKRGETWFDEIRLEGQGQEPGFFEAYTYEDIVVVLGQSDVLAFNLSDGKLNWRYRVPFDFEIRNSMMSGDLLFLAGQTDTIALYLGTEDPRGEVAWQEREEGDLYSEPYLSGDLLISVRSMPFNLTVRYRSTGQLIGRLDLPDLSMHQEHPLLEKGPEALPIAYDGDRLVVTDGFYYIMLDARTMRVAWKRLIDNNDMTREPSLRFELEGDYLAVLKKDYDVDAIYMLSSETGEVLWHTDPKDRKMPRPIHSMRIREGKMYGIRPHAGQGFYLVGLDCKTGKNLFGPSEQKGYKGRPEVELRRSLYGTIGIVQIRDRQDFELKAFDLTNGYLMHRLKLKASGNFGEHGSASGVAHNGRMALHGGDKVILAAPE